MATQLQLRKGTTSDNDSFIGAEGELTYDTETKGLRIHDGVKQGGNLIDTVIDFQLPTAENNYTWYRLYSSGWVEQGVIGVLIGTSVYTFNLPITMASSTYEVLTSVADALNTTAMSAKVWAKTTTSVQVRCTYQSGSISGDIRVSGIAA